jgi:DNA-binding IclR family transcriptional regulator
VSTPRSEVPVDVVGRAMRLLIHIGEHPMGVSLTDLARETGIPPSTTHRLANALGRDGLVQFDPVSKRYQPGLRLFELGQKAGQVYGFAGTALPVMQRVTNQTQEATLMSVLDGLEHLYVHYVDGPQPVGVRSEPGRHGPLHATSMGKVLVAFSPDDVREELLRKMPLDVAGPNVITDRDALRREIDLVRSRGYATADEEHHAGLRAVAVPVQRPGGGVFAALSTAAPAYRKSLQDLVDLVPVLEEAAAELAARLPAR